MSHCSYGVLYFRIIFSKNARRSQFEQIGQPISFWKFAITYSIGCPIVISFAIDTDAVNSTEIPLFFNYIYDCLRNDYSSTRMSNSTKKNVPRKMTIFSWNFEKEYVYLMNTQLLRFAWEYTQLVNYFTL